MNKISIVVSSCDKYSHVWPIFKYSFEKYWFNCKYPIYFITNEKDAPIGITIKTGKDKGWSNQMIKALGKIDSEIIIFLLEDYWFTEAVNNEGLEKLLQLIYYNIRIDHIRLYVSEGSKKIKRKTYLLETDLLNEDEDYRSSLNAGIWRTQTMKTLLEPNKSIWESEHSMTEKSRGRLFLTVRDMKYLKYNIDNNMVEKGKFTTHAEKYMEQESINLA